MHFTFAQYQESAQFLKHRLGNFQPKVAMVLGSGLGYLGDLVEHAIVVPYGEIPHFKPPPATRASWSSGPWLVSPWP